MTKAIAVTTLLAVCGSAQAQISLEFLGRYETGIFDDSAAEIVAYDAGSQRVFVTNAADNSVDVLCIADPTAPALEFSIDLTAFGGGINSVAVSNGLVAAAVEADVKQDPGSVVFFDTDGTLLHQVAVGALPDMLTFTPDGRFLLVANEGEPDDDYLVDPEGSVSVIRIPRRLSQIGNATVRTADFNAFDASPPEGVRVFGPRASLSQDLEPEYIAVSADSRTAWVACQENNAFAIVDIRRAKVTDLVGLGAKDHSLPMNGLDASNRDDAINIERWPVLGLYQPDAIAAFTVDGETYVVSANEGDAREYEGTPGFVEEDRIGDVVLDPTAFPDAATLQLDENLGRLKLTLTEGDTDGDRDFDELYAFGARSISIWNADGELVADTGDAMEQVTAAALPEDFNSTNDENGSFDNRSDDKGPEPEAVAVAEFNGSTYAFVGLERVGGIMTFDVSNPEAPAFVDYITSRDFAGDAELGTAGDLGPEGIVVIPKSDSPIGAPLLVVSHEVSGTTAVYRIDDGSAPCDTTGDINRDCRVDIADLLALL